MSQVAVPLILVNSDVPDHAFRNIAENNVTQIVR